MKHTFDAGKLLKPVDRAKEAAAKLGMSCETF
jgi:hypothetical protein